MIPGANNRTHKRAHKVFLWGGALVAAFSTIIGLFGNSNFFLLNLPLIEPLSIIFVLQSLGAIAFYYGVAYRYHYDKGQHNSSQTHTALGLAVTGVAMYLLLVVGDAVPLLGNVVGTYNVESYAGYEGLLVGGVFAGINMLFHFILSLVGYSHTNRTSGTDSTSTTAYTGSGDTTTTTTSGDGPFSPDGGIDAGTKEKGVNKTESELHKLAEDAEKVEEEMEAAASKTGDQKVARVEREIASNMEKVKKAVQDNEKTFEAIQKELAKAEGNPEISKQLESDEKKGHQEIIEDLKVTKNSISESLSEIQQIERIENNNAANNAIADAEQTLREMGSLFEDLENAEENLLEAEEQETKELENFEYLWEENEEFIMGLDKVAGEGQSISDVNNGEVRKILEGAAQDMQMHPEQMAKETMRLVELARKLEGEVKDDSRIRKVLKRAEAAEEVYQIYHG